MGVVPCKGVHGMGWSSGRGVLKWVRDLQMSLGCMACVVLVDLGYVSVVVYVSGLFSCACGYMNGCISTHTLSL